MSEVVEPFTSKGILLIRAMMCQEDLAGFELVEYAPFSVLPTKEAPFVVTINWERKMIKVRGPLKPEQVETVIRSEVEAYGKKATLVCGDPKKEVTLVLRDEIRNNSTSLRLAP